jgi:Na+-driven multidrug efflux pump
LITILIIIFKYPLMSLFTRDQAVIDIGGDYLTIVTSFYLLFTWMFSFGGVMRGAGDTLVPMFLTIFSLWIIRIPAAVLLSQGTVSIFGVSLKGLGMGADGIWWSIPTGWGMGLLLSMIYYRTGRWKRKTVIKATVEPATITR